MKSLSKTCVFSSQNLITTCAFSYLNIRTMSLFHSSKFKFWTHGRLRWRSLFSRTPGRKFRHVSVIKETVANRLTVLRSNVLVISFLLEVIGLKHSRSSETMGTGIAPAEQMDIDAAPSRSGKEGSKFSASMRSPPISSLTDRVSRSPWEARARATSADIFIRLFSFN